jgi:hypothetical protein
MKFSIQVDEKCEQALHKSTCVSSKIIGSLNWSRNFLPILKLNQKKSQYLNWNHFSCNYGLNIYY